VGVAEAGGVGHDDHVAEEGDARTEPHGVPGDGAHDGEVDVEQVEDHLAGVEAQVLEAARFLELREPVEVAAGREGGLGAGQQHRPGVAFGLEAGEQGGELVVEPVVHLVEVVAGGVDGDDQDVAVALEAEALEGVVVRRAGHRGFRWRWSMGVEFTAASCPCPAPGPAGR
jgi:hypothetical protein